MNKSCPHCGSFEHYYRVSVLGLSETSQINTTTRGVGVGVSTSGVGVGVGRGRTQGTIQTNLATTLAPPTPPVLMLSGCGVFGACLIGIIFTGVSALLFYDDDRSAFSLIGAVILLIVGACFILFRKAIASGEANQIAAYQKEKEAWEKSWFCKKCGEFSIPNDQEAESGPRD